MLSSQNQMAIATCITYEGWEGWDFVGQLLHVSSAKMTATRLISTVLELTLTNVEWGISRPFAVTELLISTTDNAGALGLNIARWVRLKVAEKLIVVIRWEGVVDFWPITLSWTTRHRDKHSRWHHTIKTFEYTRQSCSKGTYLSAKEWVLGSADSCPNLNCLHSY